MIVIGTDTHKRTHMLSAVDEGTGKVRGSRQIDADEPGHLAAVKWARGLDQERVWAIEDCRQVCPRWRSRRTVMWGWIDQPAGYDRRDPPIRKDAQCP
jgi:hypothetical protein